MIYEVMTPTQLIVFSTFVFWIIWASLVQNWGLPTISMTMRDLAWKFNVFAFIWGMLIGHWFFPRKTLFHSAWGYALPVMVILLAIDLYWHFSGGHRAYWRYPGLWFVVGIPVAMYFWGQRSLESPIP